MSLNHSSNTASINANSNHSKSGWLEPPVSATPAAVSCDMTIMNANSNHCSGSLSSSSLTPSSMLTPSSSQPDTPSPLTGPPSANSSPRGSRSSKRRAHSPHVRVASLDAATAHLHQRPRSSILIWPSLASDIPLPSLDSLASLHFNCLEWTEDSLLIATVKILDDMNLIVPLSVDLSKLQSFLVAIKHKYRDHPYHNFYHGFSVFQFGYFMIKRSKLSGLLTPIDQLALLISCYSHDVDHPGTTNCLEPDTLVLRVSYTDRSTTQVVRASELTASDTLIGDDGKPTRIARLNCQAISRSLFTVHQSRGLSYTVSANHRLTLESAGPVYTRLDSDRASLKWFERDASNEIMEREIVVGQSAAASVTLTDSESESESDGADELVSMIRSEASDNAALRLTLESRLNELSMAGLARPLHRGDRVDLTVDRAHQVYHQKASSLSPPQTFPFRAASEYPIMKLHEAGVDSRPLIRSWLLSRISDVAPFTYDSLIVRPVRVSPQQWHFATAADTPFRSSLMIDVALSSDEFDDDHRLTPLSLQVLQDVWDDLHSSLPSSLLVNLTPSARSSSILLPAVVVSCGEANHWYWRQRFVTFDETVTIDNIEVVRMHQPAFTVVFAPSPSSISEMQSLFKAHVVATTVIDNPQQPLIALQSALSSFPLPARLLYPHPKPPPSFITSFDRSDSSTDATPFRVIAIEVSNASHRFLLGDGTVTHNSFQVAVDSALSRIHNALAVLENHHAFITCELLRDPRCNFLMHLSPVQMRKFRKVLIGAILSTDMAIHFDLCTQFRSLGDNLALFDPMKETNVQLAINLVTHSSDLSAQCMDFTIAAQWEARVTKEFTAQAALEVELGLPPSPFMTGLDRHQTRYTNHLNFLDFVMTPLWSVVSDVLPAMRQCFESLKRNRALYEAKLTPTVEREPLIHPSNPSSSTMQSEANSPRTEVASGDNQTTSPLNNSAAGHGDNHSIAIGSSEEPDDGDVDDGEDERDIDSYLQHYFALARP